MNAARHTVPRVHLGSEEQPHPKLAKYAVPEPAKCSRFLSRPIGAIRISALGVLPQAAYSLLPYLRAGKSMPSMTLLAASNRSVAMRITSTGS